MICIVKERSGDNFKLETMNDKNEIINFQKAFLTTLPIKTDDVVEVLDDIIIFRDDLKAEYGSFIDKVIEGVNKKKKNL